MIFRTDLALEAHKILNTEIEGVDINEEQVNELNVIRMKIKTKAASDKLEKPMGNYVTIEIPSFTDDFKNTTNRLITISQNLTSLIPGKNLALVVGIGNSNITPDALGPQTASNVLATRHISGEFAKSIGLTNLRPVAVVSPGVLGQTGIEIAELILSLVKKLAPSVVIVIDALVSKQTDRLGKTIQFSDSGISPGSGVGNARPSINHKTLGVPVISIGIPTVVDVRTLAADILSINNEATLKAFDNKLTPSGQAMMVTPREIDLLIERSAKLLGMSINCALQPDFSVDDLLALMA